MPTLSSFDFAAIRVVPRVDREEFVNAGVILFCLEKRFLKAVVHMDRQRLAALWPGFDFEEVERHLEAFPKICAGDSEAGPIARMPIRERFHWLVSPRSTTIQISPVHSGLCECPDITLDEIVRKLVIRP